MGGGVFQFLKFIGLTIVGDITQLSNVIMGTPNTYLRRRVYVGGRLFLILKVHWVSDCG